MSEVVKQSAETTGPVTTTVTQHIKAGQEAAFEDWLHGVGKVAARFQGHQGLVVLPPSSTAPRTYAYMFRFDSYAHLLAWEQSADKREWTDKLPAMIEAPSNKQVLTGIEYWFQLPGNAATVPPKRYKMALVTILAIYPLSLIVPRIMRPFLDFLPSLAQSLCYSITLVVLMTYAVMPLVTRLFARWLFNKRKETP